MSGLSPKQGADLLKELCENYRPSVFHPGDHFSFRGAVAGVDSAGWAGRLESWLSATSFLSCSKSCCTWHRFVLDPLTVILLGIFSHTSNQVPEGKVLV